MSKDCYLLRTPIPMNYPGMVPMHSVNLSVLAYNGTRDNRVFVDKDNNTVYKLYDSTYGFVPGICSDIAVSPQTRKSIVPGLSFFNLLPICDWI